MATTFTSSLSTTNGHNLHLLHPNPNPKPSLLSFLFTAKPKKKQLMSTTNTNINKNSHSLLCPLQATSATNTPTTSTPNDERVQKVHTIADFDAALASAKSKLVVVEYASIEEPTTQRIYPFMVELSRTCNDVDFLLVMADESDHTRQLCDREGVDKVPHFSFYKNKEKIHDEEGIGPDQLMGDVLYYGDNHSGVVQLHSRRDVEDLINDNKGKGGKMVVLDVGLKHCGPCVKVYPLVIKLSKSMADVAVFARLNGDENDDCMEFLKEINVVEVPTFLFIKDGEVCGRYVGSGKGELIGEILKYQGVI